MSDTPETDTGSAPLLGELLGRAHRLGTVSRKEISNDRYRSAYKQLKRQRAFRNVQSKFHQRYSQPLVAQTMRNHKSAPCALQESFVGIYNLDGADETDWVHAAAQSRQEYGDTWTAMWLSEAAAHKSPEALRALVQVLPDLDLGPNSRAAADEVLALLNLPGTDQPVGLPLPEDPRLREGIGGRLSQLPEVIALLADVDEPRGGLRAVQPEELSDGALLDRLDTLTDLGPRLAGLPLEHSSTGADLQTVLERTHEVAGEAPAFGWLLATVAAGAKLAALPLVADGRWRLTPEQIDGAIDAVDDTDTLSTDARTIRAHLPSFRAAGLMPVTDQAAWSALAKCASDPSPWTALAVLGALPTIGRDSGPIAELVEGIGDDQDWTPDPLQLRGLGRQAAAAAQRLGHAGQRGLVPADGDVNAITRWAAHARAVAESTSLPAGAPLHVDGIQRVAISALLAMNAGVGPLLAGIAADTSPARAALLALAVLDPSVRFGPVVAQLPLIFDGAAPELLSALLDGATWGSTADPSVVEQLRATVLSDLPDLLDTLRGDDTDGFDPPTATAIAGEQADEDAENTSTVEDRRPTTDHAAPADLEGVTSDGVPGAEGSFEQSQLEDRERRFYEEFTDEKPPAGSGADQQATATVANEDLADDGSTDGVQTATSVEIDPVPHERSPDRTTQHHSSAASADSHGGGPSDAAAPDSEVDRVGPQGPQPAVSAADDIEGPSVGSGSDQLESDPARLAAARQRLGEMLADRHFAAAMHLAAAIGEDQIANATRALLHATGMRREAGPAAEAFTDTTRSTHQDAVTVEAARAMHVAAAIRAAAVRPHVSSGHLYTIEQWFSDSSHTAQLLKAAIVCSHQNVSLSTAAPAAPDVTDKVANDLAAEAEALLARRDAHALLFRAAQIRQKWLAPDGVFGLMLHAIVDGDSSAVVGARKMIADYSDVRAVRDLIHQFDDEGATGEMTGRPLRTLQRLAQSCVDLADRWVEHQSAAESQPETEYVASKTRELVDFRAQLSRIADELRGDAHGPVVDAAIEVSIDTINDVLTRMDEARPYSSADNDPRLEVGRPLLASPVPLDLETLEPVGPLTIDDIDDIDPEVDLSEAFASRVERLDVDEATFIVTIIEERDPKRAAELDKQLKVAQQQAVEEAEAEWADAQRLLRQAERQAWLTQDQASQLLQQLEAGEVTDEIDTDQADDIGHRRRLTRRLVDELELARATKVAEVESQVPSDLDPAVSARIAGMLEHGDTLIAQELLDRHEQGRTLSTELEVDDRLKAGPWTRLLDAADHIDARQVDPAIIIGGGKAGPVDYAPLRSGVADVNATVWESWQSLSDQAVAAHRYDGPIEVERVLVGLGLEGVTVTSVKVRGGRSMRWFEAAVERSPDALLPDYGSKAAKYRILLGWPGVTPRALVSAADAHRDGRAVIALLFDSWGPDQRAELAVATAEDRVPLLLVDDLLMLYRLSLEDASWRSTVLLAAPYSATNPYVTSGSVAREMFYGRRSELRQLAALDGPAVLSAARQIGKTALATRVRNEFNRQSDAESVLVEVRNVGKSHPTTQVWNEIHRKLRRRIDLPDIGSSDPRHVVTDGVAQWLEKDLARRLLILLDECDEFLNGDRDEQFEQVVQLKRISEDFPDRAKVVFIGLHSVQRFSRDPNQPFAHMGADLSLGGLPPQDAYQLLAEPLWALGYEFDDPDTVMSAVVTCNYSPAVLQQFGYSLLEHLLSNRHGGPPWTVARDEVNQVLDSPEMSATMREKFRLTLDLDEHYRLICNIMALDVHEYGERRPWSAKRMAVQAGEYWPRGFGDEGPRADDIGLLLDEMTGLGVLARDSDGYTLRNANITRLLGSLDEVFERLQSFADLTPDGDYRADTYRQPVITGRLSAPSPLSDEQLHAVTARADGTTRLLLTTALGREQLQPLLAQYDDAQPQLKLTEIDLSVRNRDVKLRQTDFPGVQLYLSDLSGKQPPQAARADERAQQLVALPHTGHVRVLTVFGEDHLDAIADLLATDDPNLIGGRRLGQDAVRWWAAAADEPLPTDDAVAHVTEVTGGWPFLLARAARKAEATPGLNLTDAAEAVADELTSDTHATTLLEATGLAHLTGQIQQVWVELLNLGGGDSDILEELIADVVHGGATNANVARARRARQLLQWLQVLRYAGGTVSPEPVAARCWRQVHG